MFVRMLTHRHLFSTFPWYLAPADDSGQGAGGDGGDDDGGDDKGGDEGGRTFTQAELDRIVGRRASESERQASRKLLEELGVKDAGEAKKLLDAARKAADRDKSETEKATAKAAEQETIAQRATREAAEARMQLKIDRKLLAAGVKPAKLERLSKTVYVELEDDADDDAIKTAIDDIKTDFPEAFTDDNGEGEKDRKTGPAPSGRAADGKGPKGNKGTTSALERGRQRARELQGRDKQKTA